MSRIPLDQIEENSKTKLNKSEQQSLRKSKNKQIHDFFGTTLKKPQRQIKRNRETKFKKPQLKSPRNFSIYTKNPLKSWFLKKPWRQNHKDKSSKETLGSRNLFSKFIDIKFKKL